MNIRIPIVRGQELIIAVPVLDHEPDAVLVGKMHRAVDVPESRVFTVLVDFVFILHVYAVPVVPCIAVPLYGVFVIAVGPIAYLDIRICTGGQVGRRTDGVALERIIRRGFNIALVTLIHIYGRALLGLPRGIESAVGASLPEDLTVSRKAIARLRMRVIYHPIAAREAGVIKGYVFSVFISGRAVRRGADCPR